MMWDQVIEKTLAALRADATMKTLTGVDVGGFAQIYKSRSGVVIQIPSVVYTVVSSVVSENEAPVLVQWDVWAESPEQASALELRMYQMMHSDLPVNVGGLAMWSQLVNRYDVQEDDQGSLRSVVEYKYTPARENG
jgi:hypothetical protein